MHDISMSTTMQLSGMFVHPKACAQRHGEQRVQEGVRTPFAPVARDGTLFRISQTSACSKLKEPRKSSMFVMDAEPPGKAHMPLSMVLQIGCDSSTHGGSLYTAWRPMAPL